MIDNVPQLPDPRPKTVAAQPAKPWMVNIAIDDPKHGQKLRQLGLALGKKPGRVVADAVIEWLDSLDIDQLQQEELPIAKAS